MSKERPILFSGPMVRAILEGRKTQTRRVVKVPAWADPSEPIEIGVGGVPEVICQKTGCLAGVNCPYGVAGDKLWVRETWCNYPLAGVDCTPGLIYRATNDCVPRGMWKPSIHMPRWASRLTLEVTGVRVERLQDISREDAICEGWDDSWRSSEFNDRFRPILWFCDLWESINGPESWAANPWVWVVEFTKAKRGNE